MAYDLAGPWTSICQPAARSIPPELPRQIKASSVANEVTDGRRKRRPTSQRRRRDAALASSSMSPIDVAQAIPVASAGDLDAWLHDHPEARDVVVAIHR